MAKLVALIFLAVCILGVDSLVCQLGYNVTVGDHCYKIQYIEHGLEKADAKERCAKENAILPSIHSEEDNADLLAARDLQCLNCFAFLGIACTEEGKLGWGDGSPLDYTHFWPGSFLPSCDPKTFETTDDFIFTDKGYWRDFADGSSVGALICQQVNQDYGCGDFDEVDDQCYKVFGNKRMQFNDAENYCQEIGGHLASLHDDKTSDFIRRSAVSQGVVEPIFIGLERMASGDFEWTDGSKPDYINFASSDGSCAVLHTESTLGFWTAEACDVPKPFVCERKNGTGYDNVNYEV
ncbi:hypothetical protein PENTCL1PPCAC_3880 [Pristionchus entomophagus]|uniref:C-type lectin domain-containing protein n=1 Tax=Pristionchus entomophagus TaxID=358040 RepID=A0AAV5SNL8_9BILA|nr:hypothetical protein PENTCL1PPCAC_3880 [Pristionchus entomophagus]